MRPFQKIWGISILGIAFILGTGLLEANAHDFCLESRDYTPRIGDYLELTLGYGHYFPAQEFMPSEYLENIYMIGPDGEKIRIKKISDTEFRSEKRLDKGGTYLIVASKKGGFFTKTAQGWKRGQSKKGLKNVIKCSYSEKYAKAIVNVGPGKGNHFSTITGAKLEIVPLAEPSELKQDGYMPVKVLYEGKPLGGEYIFATYAGFSPEKNVFAYATKTNNEGMARIKIIKPGNWLIVVRHEIPYPDSDECDKISCSSALTFKVK